MIRVKRTLLNSSYYPDWYTDKDFVTKYVDGRGYTEYYVDKTDIPDYLWEAFTRWTEYLTYAFISYAYTYIPAINAGSSKININRSSLVFKYKIVQSAIPEDTITDRYVGNTKLAEVIEQTHDDIDKWLDTWTSSKIHAWLCDKIASMACDELFTQPDMQNDSIADDNVYYVLSAYVPMNKSEFYNIMSDDRSISQYSKSKSDLTLYLADFDIETLWSLYIACWNKLKGVEQFFGHYKIENIY